MLIRIVFLLLAFLFTHNAEAQRSTFESAGSVLAVAASGFGQGFALGGRDGAANDLRLEVNRSHYGSEEALRLNRVWHTWGWATKSLMVVNFGTGVTIGGFVDPTPTEALVLTALWGGSLGLGFHFGHNWQQGKSWDYFGSVDTSDQWVKSVGPRPIVVVSVVTVAGVAYLGYRLLRR